MSASEGFCQLCCIWTLARSTQLVKHLHLALQSPFSFHHWKSTGGSYICHWGTLSALSESNSLVYNSSCAALIENLLASRSESSVLVDYLSVKSWLHKFTVSWCKFAYLLWMGTSLLLRKQLKWERMSGISVFSIPRISSPKLNLSFRAIFTCQLWSSAGLLSAAHRVGPPVLLVQRLILIRLSIFILFF